MEAGGEVYFENITEIFKEKINAVSGGDICVQAYYFTDKMIADLLIRAKQRSANILVLMDRNGAVSKYSVVPYLIRNGIQVRCDYADEKAHNKVMIMDGVGVITGSYNYTVSASKYNAENVIFINDKNVFQKYKSNFNERWNKAFEFVIIPKDLKIVGNKANVITYKGERNVNV
ncbi:MAG: phospholipase D-like domain-containing protein [Deltaproteobacteria bacterium]|jgi:phosphatidylserine/phosphatidylglycerophosphate/cardiolipin synthase-like enzyme|nr:phospholipase D-like domain-containing protein [Deltaproteobacteria bacterium]